VLFRSMPVMRYDDSLVAAEVSRCHPGATAMILYHLTTAIGLAGICNDGVIRRTWPAELSEALPYRVVWLTSEESSKRRGWKEGVPMGARITVDVPDEDVYPWSEWKRRVPPEAASGLEASARGWGGDPDTWCVIERDVPQDEWLEIIESNGD